MTETEQQAIEFYNAGLAHMRSGRLADARACYERALAIRPGYIQARHNFAVLLDDLGQHVAAEAQFRMANAADPEAAEPWAGLGGNLRIQGKLAEARAAYERALSLRAEFPAARWNLALIDLAEGRFADGWMNYLFRPSVDRKAAPLVALPRDLSGAVAEIVDEQGLGDALFFLRFAPQLRARGATIRFEPDPRLAGIVSRMMDFGETSTAGSTIRVALGDIPYLLGVETCPRPLIVAPLASSMMKMSAALAAAGPKPYTAVTWRAGQRADGYLYKDIPIAQLGSCFRPGSGTLISVQRAPLPGEREQLEDAAGRPVIDFSACNADLEDMLALMSLLTEYVGVSNTNMHLRAASGNWGRVLIPNPAEYRWMAVGDESPWFPGFTLYRQSSTGGWDDVLMRLADDLQS